MIIICIVKGITYNTLKLGKNKHCDETLLGQGKLI